MGHDRKQGLEVTASENGGRFCRLTGVLDFTTVPGLALQLPDLFSRGGRLQVDLSAVTRADSAGMALLLEMQRLAGEADCGLSLENVPASLVNIIRISELDPVLPLAD